MIHRLLLLFLFIPFCAAAQYRITGKVIDSASGNPVSDASVLLGNSQSGGKTDRDGIFSIDNIRGGQYNLVVSVVGYVPYSQGILVNQDIHLPTITIKQQAIMLNEVKIAPDKNWDIHYAIFKRYFVGSSDNADRFVILNPHVLGFDADDKEFTASADDFLEMENKALGYKVKYLLHTFSFQYSNNKIYFAGEAFFSDLPGSARQLKKWKEARLKTYIGSDMHFFRSLISGQVTAQGFVARRLIHKKNPDYNGHNSQFADYLIKTPLAENEFLKTTDKKGEYAIVFSDYLQVSYKDGQLDSSTIIIDGPYALFDHNGIILNPQDVTMQGNWGDRRLPDLLPVDYETGQ